MFKKINKHESYWGTVVDVEDTLKAGRIKVKVFGVFDEISDEHIPWAESIQDIVEHDLPAVGETVLVKFPTEVPYLLNWYRKRSMYEGRVTDANDYASSSIILEKNLERYDLDGYVRISYTESEGLVHELTKEDKTSTVIIRPDGTILLQNEKSKQSIHIAEDNISIGREGSSQQPAVVGNDNHEALKKLNEEIKDLSIMMDSWLDKLFQVCSKISFLAPLAPLFKGYGAEVKSKIQSIHSANDKFFPETLSEVVTVDKTLPD